MTSQLDPVRTKPASPPAAAPVGVFDSGVGGLSVLQALKRQLSGTNLIYVADSAHAPYGEREAAHVVRRSQCIVDHLASQGASLIVMACNTATALAIDALRATHPQLSFIGIEPGVKPAASISVTKRIAVMATPATLASARYADLVARHAPGCQVHAVPCAGLAAAIEQGEACTDEIDRLLDLYCTPLNDLGIDTLVLGCTHYPFVGERIAARLRPGIAILDTADPVARRAVNMLGTPAQALFPPPTLRLQTTGEPELLARMARLGMGQQVQVDRVVL